jgi:ribonucleoside-diphosphate reductase alpha chain
MEIYVTKRDGTREPFDADRINKSIERACEGLENAFAMVAQIATETRLTIYDGVTSEELDMATMNAAIQNIKDDIRYDKVATRLLLKTVYRRVIGEYGDDKEILKKRNADAFVNYVKTFVADKILDQRMVDLFDLDELGATLDLECDELLKYSGASTILARYAIKGRDQKPAEPPQFFFMRVAMGMSYNEKNPTEYAKKFYAKMSQLEYIAGGSTNVSAGTVRPALSNCFLIQVEDDMEHIAKSVADVMLISKHTGGLGLSVTKLRASGSPLVTSNTVSTGPGSFAKIFDTAIRAIQRGGKKKGALAFYMENWHLDFPEFIDWKHNAGDDYQRMRTANTAAFISDEFMERVQKNLSWYMFDPKETPDLIELYGKAFKKRYAEYIELAETGKMRAFKKVPAREQWRNILVALQGTSHPWITWKDPINLRALNNNTGTIHMSNLCTEICLPQDRDNVAVCNLATVNIVSHLTEDKDVDWQRFEHSVRTAVRHLDNLIDINQLPIEEARRSDSENRAIGLGVMGFADAVELLGFSYDSPQSYDFADKIFEFVSYMAIDESANLAAERGSYKNFPGSEWSKGKVPVDTLERLEADRGRPLSVDKGSKHKGLDWDALRAKVKQGMRNATLMAVAPNANIGLVASTVPGIDARFAQIFSRNKASGKYMDINHNLVRDLEKINLWDKVKEKIIEAQGDIGDIAEIPQHLKDIYKTSFTTSPFAYIEVAARAQKWVDQSLSRNMYLETRDIDEMMRIYETAWEKGLKTTYYLHMKPRHSAEQSTTSVNKSTAMGKVGFGALMARKTAEKAADAAIAAVENKAPESVPVIHVEEREEEKEKVMVAGKPKVCPIDPAERELCDSCQ